MFNFDATPVKFVGLLILFAFTTVWSIYELTRKQTRTQVVSNSAHLYMSVVMVLMVPQLWWRPFIKVVGMPIVLGLMVLSTLWFIGLAFRAYMTPGRPGFGHLASHSAMFGAMTWHLWAMSVKMPHMGPDMGKWMMQASQPGQILWLAALIGVPFMTYLLVSSLLYLRNAFRPAMVGAPAVVAGAFLRQTEQAGTVLTDTGAPSCCTDGSCQCGHAGGVCTCHDDYVAPGCHEERPVGSTTYRLTELAGFAMNFGMFWMSTGLMVPLLPFFKYLAF